MKKHSRKIMCVIVAICIAMVPCYAYSKKEKNIEIHIDAVDEDMQGYIVDDENEEPLVWTNRDVDIRISATSKEKIAKLEYVVGDGQPIIKEYSHEQEKITEKATAEKVTTEERTTEVATTDEATTQESTTEEATTQEEGKTEESTKQESTTEALTTEEAATWEEGKTEESTTQESMTEESTTEEATTQEGVTTEEVTTQDGTTEEPTTEEKTTEVSTTQESTTQEVTENPITTEEPTTEKKKEPSKVREEVAVSVSAPDSRGIPVKVSVTDVKGRTQTLIRWIHIDKTAPVIEYTGVDNNALRDDDINVAVDISECNYQLDKIKAFGTRTDIDGEEHLISFSEIERVENGGKLSVVAKDDGVYKIHVGVTDAAGNTTDKELHFLIDKMAPMLPDISDISGKTYETFSLADYGKPVFKDLTLLESKMILNGYEYDGKTRITESGRYNLYVEAMDELGHKSSGTANFLIAKDDNVDEKTDDVLNEAMKNDTTNDTKENDAKNRKNDTTQQKDAQEEEIVYNDEEKNPSMKKEILLWLGLSCLIWTVLFLIRKNSTANTGE